MFDIIQNRTNVQNIYSEVSMFRYIRKIKRSHIVKMPVIAASLVLTAMIFTLSFAIRSSAQSFGDPSDGEVYYRYTAMYRVCAGDTLSSIAKEYMDDIHYSSEAQYINEIRKMNGMYGSDDLTTGELISVCYYSTEYK